ncbi:hypothetical protein KSP39_PZI020307 [Platanthera zijinensis]|uniref:Uncharacterized protein n=1 Tax=Platanthera zijinensis TaxID=2320716 RepID=A0AAP0B0L3_9ASPA
MRECQFSDERIGVLLINEGRRVIGRAPKFLKSIVKRFSELGVPPRSGMFYHTFRCLCGVSLDMFDAKIKLLGSLEFSQSELSAILKQPFVIQSLCQEFV